MQTKSEEQLFLCVLMQTHMETCLYVYNVAQCNSLMQLFFQSSWDLKWLLWLIGRKQSMLTRLCIEKLSMWLTNLPTDNIQGIDIQL